MLKNIKSVTVPNIPKNYKHVAYRCNILLNPQNLIKGYDRDKIMTLLEKNKIKCFVGACPEIYNEKIFKKIKKRPIKRLKNTKFVGENSLSFLVHPTIPEKKIVSDAKKIKKILTAITK